MRILSNKELKRIIKDDSIDKIVDMIEEQKRAREKKEFIANTLNDLRSRITTETHSAELVDLLNIVTVLADYVLTKEE